MCIWNVILHYLQHIDLIDNLFSHEFKLVFAFAGVLFCEHQRVFGTEVDVRVKAGDNITLYGDCVIPLGSHIVWLRNCSHEHQPSLLIETINLFGGMFPRFSFVQNSSSNSYDLHIENVSVSDEGIYYCAIDERKVNGVMGSQYKYGNRRTRLSVLGKKIFLLLCLSILENFTETVGHILQNIVKLLCWSYHL